MLNLAGIEIDSVVDGPGLRTVLFLQGCDHHCPGCHNPEAQGIGGYFTSVDDLAGELTKGNGDIRLTLSGGEPMLQANVLFDLLYKMRIMADLHRKIDVWCYTGFTWDEIQANKDMKYLADICNVIVDGRFELDKRDSSLLFRGSSNQRLIDVKRTLEMGTIVEWKE